MLILPSSVASFKLVLTWLITTIFFESSNFFFENRHITCFNYIQALRLFSMIHAGDRILVHLSGGKSSLALLHCLHAYQDILREENSDSALKNVFEMGAVVVALAHENYDLLPLVNYLKSLGVTYYYERQGKILTIKIWSFIYACSTAWIALFSLVDMNKYCSHSLDLCSSLKQKVIYNVARKYGYNVLALAQNLDEMAARYLLFYSPSQDRFSLYLFWLIFLTLQFLIFRIQ